MLDLRLDGIGEAQPWHVKTRCCVPRCPNGTRERKPFCSEHVGEHPYVQGLRDALEASAVEVERVARFGPRAVDLEGINAREVLRELAQHGDRTRERLARDLKLPPEIVQGYLEALAHGGLVALRSTRRGTYIAAPAERPQRRRRRSSA